jgi:hypothetical protein
MWHLYLLLFSVINNNYILCENDGGIKEWWDKMSEKKPVKCSHEDVSWQEPLSKYVKTKALPEMIYSGPCKPNETPVQFSFKGKIENFKLEGPGKLKLNPK